MPNRDKTGPEGKGPKTGRGEGPCEDDNFISQKMIDELIDDEYWEEVSDDDYDEMEEALRRKIVVRKGKRIRKKVLSKAEKKSGYAVRQGKKVKMSAMERMKRRRAARKGARKAKSKRGIATRKRLRSMKRRTGLR